jgi:hypothetical protein
MALNLWGARADRGNEGSSGRGSSPLFAELDRFFADPGSTGMASAIVGDLMHRLRPDLAPAVQDMTRQMFASGAKPGDLIEMILPNGADPKLLESFFRAAGNDCEIKGRVLVSRCGNRYPVQTKTFEDLARLFGGKGDEFLDTLRRFQII